LSGQISLHNVNFRYSADAPDVLRNIDLTIQAGQKVAIVGRTGSGKSTLGRLLLGLYPASEGELLFDGIPLNTLNYRSLSTQFCVVTQEPFLFNTSIRENISLQCPELPLNEVLRAAQLAGIHKEILQMPMGYETRVAEGGSGLSGGQRQRLALARALAHKPAILLLDEATSHLDVLTEQRVDTHLNQLACTRIVIAHRLSTIRNADLIVVLEEGVMIERGTHTELLAQDGFYASLVRSQVERTDTLAMPESGEIR
jgi:ABC-type bacteriocin/lantibiotic exporter with double-glycine peptidase domain